MHLHHIFCLPSMINAPLNPAWILVGADYQWDSVLKEPYGQLFGPAFLICWSFHETRKVSHFHHIWNESNISQTTQAASEEILTQVADMCPAAELSLACASLSLEPTMEASNKASIFNYLFFTSFLRYDQFN